MRIAWRARGGKNEVMDDGTWLDPESETGSTTVANKLKWNPKETTRKLKFWPLVALIFFEVSGGPFGIEDTVQTGGPLPTVLGLLLFPLVWSIPEALVTAELASMYPEDSGYVKWVSSAFGPFWGFQEGWWSWTSGVIDNSIYPLLLTRYLEELIPALGENWFKRLFCILTSLVLTYLNWRGLQVVGNIAIFLTCFVLLPFIVLSLVAIPQINASNWFVFKGDRLKKNFVEFFNVMFWNLNYWDSVSTLAGEVHNPTKTFPRALGAGLVITILGYLVPVLVGLGVVDLEGWPSNFAAIGKLVAGGWLEVWIILAAVGSQVGLYEAEMSSDSYQIFGMAEKGILPKCFAVKSRYGTPTVGILLSSTGVAVMCLTFQLEKVVETLNYAYGFAVLLEYASFIYLRIKDPHAHRPYKVPLSTPGICVMLCPAIAFVLFLLIIPWIQLKYDIMVFSVGLVLTGVLLYKYLGYVRQHRWFEFEKTERELGQSGSLDDVEEENEHKKLLRDGTPHELSLPNSVAHRQEMELAASRASGNSEKQHINDP